MRRIGRARVIAGFLIAPLLPSTVFLGGYIGPRMIDQGMSLVEALRHFVEWGHFPLAAAKVFFVGSYASMALLALVYRLILRPRRLLGLPATLFAGALCGVIGLSSGVVIVTFRDFMVRPEWHVGLLQYVVPLGLAVGAVLAVLFWVIARPDRATKNITASDAQ